MSRFAKVASIILVLVALTSATTDSALADGETGGQIVICLGDYCAVDQRLVTSIPPSADSVLEFTFTLNLSEVAFDRETELTHLEVSDVRDSSPALLRMMVVSDQVGQVSLNLAYQISPNFYRNLSLGAVGPEPEEETIRVRRIHRQFADSSRIDVERSGTPYSTGTVVLSGTPKDVVQGNLKLTGGGEGTISISPVVFP